MNNNENLSNTSINWFPGHMKKTLEVLEEEIKYVDVVLYLVDSRAPLSSVNPEFKKIIKNKPKMYIFNKADLVDLNELKNFYKYFEDENTIILPLNSSLNNSTQIIIKKLDELNIRRVTRNANKNLNIPLRIMVIGIPNVGKSTLINNMCKHSRAKTGNKPGVTKTKQWVKVNANLELLDTPGTLWPNLGNIRVAHNLAYIGSIKDEVVIISDLVYDLISDLIKLGYAKNLEDRYNIKIDGKEIIEIYDDIALSRGFVMKNKEIDYERSAKAILTDYRSGKLGKIILDR